MTGVLETEGYASFKDEAVFEPFKYRLPDLRPSDLLVEVLWCGLCHSDIFLAKEEWGSTLTLRPLVAGHHVIARVLRKGPLCNRFNVSDVLGIGFISEACGRCDPCRARSPASCEGRGFISIFSAVNIYREDRCLGTGGFGRHMVIHEDYAIRIPPKLIDSKLPFRACLFCSGLAVWSSLKSVLKPVALSESGPQSLQTARPLTVAVLGLGAAGHLATQILCGLGHQVVCISSNRRKEIGIKKICPDVSFVHRSDDIALSKWSNKINILLDCCTVPKKVHKLMDLLKHEGTYIALAIPSETNIHEINQQVMARKRLTLTGVFMGSQTEVDELLEWVSNHHPEIYCRSIVMPLGKINEAVQMMEKNSIFDGQHFGVVFDCQQ
eukprot:Blabericola_migrator_1__1517@NODE_13_length_24280_cov_225_960393_g10_i0_p6_GENE_NODE_13_length_24280_cov_225_960393_g10_i0NODE_13_length_24280_cov_225_960393_g10_i0_p6_ORF_typecomplete_len381_score36_76ADH_N/PF08240_12/5_5e16Glu_dehyd_C/PF16912_5/1_1e12ADH_zinc_N/PF00107_26/3_6e08ADH_zinc_N_2/PF13602_6/8_4e06AlaDh_PNT_C/PF01262_21/0_000222Hacid_dh_C/PF02826_19/0_048ELFV_dehydrog/PF00208_21/0_073Pex26/PF07163_12/0_12Pyr_redox_2/PF07992_14/0_1Pyr_redox/PF00070_27/0_54_NODE_13_length_24280_cov_225_